MEVSYVYPFKRIYVIKVLHKSNCVTGTTRSLKPTNFTLVTSLILCLDRDFQMNHLGDGLN